MKQTRTLLLAVLFTIVGGLHAQEKESTDLKPALSATVAFAALDGDTADKLIAPHAPFEIQVRIHNHASQDPPAGLKLFGWLRRIDPSNLPCGESAESFFRTSRLPVGAVFLNNPLVAMLTEDNSILLIDPEFSLAAANILQATKLSSRPAGITVDHNRRRLLVTLPNEGRVVSIDIAGRVSDLGAELDQPVDVIASPDGDVVVLANRQIIRVPDGPLPLIRSEVSTLTAVQTSAVVRTQQEVILFDIESGTTQLSWQGQADSAIGLAGLNGVMGLAVTRGKQLLITYLDASNEPATIINLDTPVKKLVSSRDGRFVFAYNPAGGPVSIIDLALSQLVQTTSAGDTAISDIVVGESAAYLMLADQSRVGVLDLGSLAHQGLAEFREVPLGSVRDKPLDDQQLLTSFWPDSGILAVHAQSRQGYRLHDYAAMGNAPAMTAIPLRGGVPREVHAIDRSFYEDPVGTFRTMSSLPGKGRWELVATTGLGSLSFCAELPVSEPDDVKSESGQLFAVVTDEPSVVQLRTLDSDGEPLVVNGTLKFAALSGAWNDHAPLTTDANGLSLQFYELPSEDTIVLTLETANKPFGPLLLERTP